MEATSKVGGLGSQGKGGHQADQKRCGGETNGEAHGG
jgi:hypothetical protein